MPALVNGIGMPFLHKVNEIIQKLCEGCMRQLATNTKSLATIRPEMIEKEVVCMNTMTAHETVILIRVLRDGTVTEERFERWLAELVIGCLPQHDPSAPRARISTLPLDEYRRRPYSTKRTSPHEAYRHALEFARLMGATDLR